MKLGLSLITLLLCRTCAHASEVTPVQKVVVLLEGMLAKGKAEKHDEQVQFAAYRQFCDGTSEEKGKAIKEATKKIEMLEADIEFATATVGTLTKEIAGLEADISTWQGDIEAATKVRAMEKKDYVTSNRDYSESIDALERAIAVLKKQAYNRKQEESLAQVAHLKNLNLIPPEAKKTIDAFLSQQNDEAGELAVFSVNEAFAPESNAYEFQSTSIVDMLEKLLDKFVSERTDKQKDEMNAKHAYDMLLQDLKAQISAAEEAVKKKSGAKAESMEDKASAEGDLTDTTATKDEDTKYLADLTATCTQKATDFESRQQLRADELVAIEKAIEIISSAKVTGAAEKYLPSVLVQKKTALVQLRGDDQAEMQKRVSQFLQRQADKLNSRILSSVAVRASADPFAKVKKMIKDLIVRLMEEANEEAEHKGWCDTELATNEATRKEKTQSVEKLTAEIEELTSSIAKLTEDVADLSAAVAELDAAMAKATSLREKEKETNTETIKDASEAQAAVAQAITILKQFYEKAGDATALMQKQPDIFDSPYKGMVAQSGGVVGMLEVIESDFARLEADTKAEEASSQKSYDTFMTDSTVDKKAKTTDVAHKTAKKESQKSALVSRKGDLEGTQAELDTALAYYDKLKPSCVDSGVSYDNRVGRRQEEIESLKEALRILDGVELA